MMTLPDFFQWALIVFEAKQIGVFLGSTSKSHFEDSHAKIELVLSFTFFRKNKQLILFFDRPT